MHYKHLEIKNLFKTFPLSAGFFAKAGKMVHAVNGVTLTINRGECFGIVGESGSGKSTLSKMLVASNKSDGGNILFYDGDKVIDYSSKKRDIRIIRNKIKYVFQDPTSSLDPRMKVKDLLSIGIKYSKKGLKNFDVNDKIKKTLTAVGLNEDILERRVSQFSGGQKQRISLARALMFDPEILICDEVVSALDVSIRSQILNLLIDLKKEYNLTLIFIAHDLAVVSYLCDRVAVMYGGQIMEVGDAQKIFFNPQHPYTKLFVKSIPSINKEFINIEQDVNFFNPIEELHGCPFYNRCPNKKYICSEEVKTKELDDTRVVRCNF